MSKKTRKKSGKSLASRKARATASKASAKRTAVNTGRSPTTKSGKSRKSAQARAQMPSSKVAKPKIAKPKAAATSNRKSAVRPVLAEGEKAPSFRLPRDGGSAVSLQDFAGQKLVLFFYPRADTPGCTREAIDFNGLRREFASIGADIFGISADSVASHQKFKKKHALDFALLADEQRTALESYGVWVEKSMYGRKYMGVERTTVLIDAAGVIRRIWTKVKVAGHAAEVLEAARQL